MKGSYRKAFLRNQVIHFINFGHITSTTANIKQVRRLAEKLVTVARDGNEFNARRKAQAMLPYSQSSLLKLFKEIAPQYSTRPGGYTRILPLGQRPSDTASMSRLEWV
ncbi:MAG: 50S ribosomal protein L17 [Candidatus Chromulinivorax sp.]